MKNIPFITNLLVVVAVTASTVVQAVEVTASGSVEIQNNPSYKEQALAKALCEAIRKGVGVDLMGNTSVVDFIVNYDKVLTSAFGHVNAYKVIRSGNVSANSYEVVVLADVEKGLPALQNQLALRHLIQMRGSPTISVNIKSNVDSIVNFFVEEIAKELQLNLKENSSDADFVIDGQLTLKYVGQVNMIGQSPKRSFSLSGQLKVVDQSNKEVIATVTFPGTEQMLSNQFSVEAGSIEVLREAIIGREIPPIFQKMFTRWIADVDLKS
jgi:hypothetical protein